MLQRCLFQTSALVALAALALVLGAVPRTRADEPRKLVHLQISLYELREAKQDVRNVKDIPDQLRTKILGGIDNAIDQMKKTIEAGGVKAEYIHPDDRPDYANFQHLRHAVKKMKEAKEQLKLEKGVPDDAREKGLREIDTAVDLLEKALDYVK